MLREGGASRKRLRRNYTRKTWNTGSSALADDDRRWRPQRNSPPIAPVSPPAAGRAAGTLDPLDPAVAEASPLGRPTTVTRMSAAKQPLGHAPRVVERDPLDHLLPAVDIIDAEMVELQLHEQRGDFGRGVEIEHERAVQISFGFGELVGGGAVVGEAMDFLLDQTDGFVGAVGARRRRAEKHRTAIVPHQAVADRVNEAAFLAHFVIKPRGKRAAAENVVDDVGGKEIRIVTRDAGPAEIDHRLRHVEIDIDAPPEPLRHCRRDRRQLCLRRQRAEHAVEHGLCGVGVDVADDRDLEVVARQHPMLVSLQIVDGDCRHRFQRAADRVGRKRGRRRRSATSAAPRERSGSSAAAAARREFARG